MEPILSQCKLKKRVSFLKAFSESCVIIDFKFVDFEDWLNDEITAVFTFNYEDALQDERWSLFMQITHNLKPNKLSWKYSGDTAETERIYFKFQWLPKKRKKTK